MAWNCQGIRSNPTVRRLRNLQVKHSPDIVFLMETKNQDDDVFKNYEKTPYTNHFMVPPIGLSGGLALSWKDHVELDILDSSPNFIDTKITTGVETTFVTFLYGAPRQEDRASLWEKLTCLGNRRDEAWLLT